jgi:DNA-binding IclR family transcriptional regulator
MGIQIRTVNALEDGSSRLSQRRVAHRGTRKGVKSVEVGMALVTALAESTGPLSLKALSAVAKLPPGKAHRYLASFARCELIAQDAETGQYDLGPLALRLGFAAQTRIDALQRGILCLERLARESGHTAMLTCWSQRGPVILRWVQGPRPVYTTLSLGAVLPLLRSATGHIYLAYLPEPLTKPLIAREIRLSTQTNLNIISIKAQVRQSGCGEVSGDLIPGLIAAAAPIFDGRDTLVSALTLISTTTIGWSSGARTRLLGTARTVSRELGWSASLGSRASSRE